MSSGVYRGEGDRRRTDERMRREVKGREGKRAEGREGEPRRKREEWTYAYDCVYYSD